MSLQSTEEFTVFDLKLRLHARDPSQTKKKVLSEQSVKISSSDSA